MNAESRTVVSRVSFVMPAWNEEAVLPRSLAALFAVGPQLNTPFEVIVADDDSTDRTADIAREMGATVVASRHRQIAATRNAGARVAQGDLLVFVDADTWVNATVVKAAVQAVQAGAVGGGCAVEFDKPIPLYARLLLPVFNRLYRAAGLAAGCFLFCTRQAFDAAGGFDEGLYASEECALSWALRRHGRFVVLRETVLTSSRKLRTYSGWEILGTLLRLGLHGSVRDRVHKEIWYGPRRPDPQLRPRPD